MPDDSPATRPEPVHETDARRLLQDAAALLARARTALTASPPDYRAAAPAVRLCVETALAAYAVWQGMVVPDRTDLAEVAEQVARLDSTLRTPAHRAVLLVPGLRAAESGARVDVAVREAVETGWYTARNLISQVAIAVPARARPTAFDPAQPLCPPAPDPPAPDPPAPRSHDRVEVSSEDSFPASDAPGWQPLVVGRVPRRADGPEADGDGPSPNRPAPVSSPPLVLPV